MPRFNSKLHAMGMAKRKWICRDCNHEAARKFKTCPVCQSKDVLYFASGDEAKRYYQLRLMAKLKQITDLDTQPEFPAVINGRHVFLYKADFRYKTINGREIIEDVKGVETDVFKLKKSVIEALHDVEIKVVRMRS